MEIVNGILLILAVAFIWGAVNLERPATAKVETNQSDQANDSLNLLKKISKKRSPVEEAQIRRLNANKSHTDKINSQIPRTMEDIKDSHYTNVNDMQRKFRQLDFMIRSIDENVKNTNEGLTTKTNASIEELSILSERLGDLSRAIEPLDNDIVSNLDSLNSIAKDSQKVRESVGY